MKLLSFLLSAFAALALNSTTYYVDRDTGSNTNDGLCSTTPWFQAPGDPLATDVPLATLLQPGDIVLFKRGTVYPGRLRLGRSGTNGVPIVYGSTNTWGDGPYALLDRSYNALSDFCTATNELSYITFDGLMIREWGTLLPSVAATMPADSIGNSAYPGYGIRFDTNDTWIHKNIVIQNCAFDEIGHWTNVIANADGSSIVGVGIAMLNAQNWTITNCVFSRMRNPISIKGNDNGISSNITIVNCTFGTNIVWGIDVAAYELTEFRDIIVRNSVFKNYTELDQANWIGGGDAPHTDGVFLRQPIVATAGTVWTNFVIDRCKFYAEYNPNGSQGTASIFISQGPSARIQNCLFVRDSKTRAIYVKDARSNQLVEAYNNTFAFLSSFYIDSLQTNTVVRLKNNAWLRNDAVPASQFITTSRPVAWLNESDRNMFYNPNFTAGTHYPWVIFGSTYRTLSVMQSTYAMDLNSYWVDPKFNSPYVTPPGDFRPMGDSPMLGAGENLTSLGITTDIEGNARPSVGAWTVGAYQNAYP